MLFLYEVSQLDQLVLGQVYEDLRKLEQEH